MVKHYIIRKILYDEETRNEYELSHQVSVMLKHTYKTRETVYEARKTNGLIVSGESIYCRDKHTTRVYLIIYVKEESLALKLADRWCNENNDSLNYYHVKSVEHAYSIF